MKINKSRFYISKHIFNLKQEIQIILFNKQKEYKDIECIFSKFDNRGRQLKY